MLNTFLSDMRTQSKTAFSFGIRLIVLSGLKSRKIVFLSRTFYNQDHINPHQDDNDNDENDNCNCC